MEPTIRRATTGDGVTIAFAVSGPPTGPVVVLLPGVPFSNMTAEWRIPVVARAFARLAERVRFVQLDGRGTGQSQRDVSDLGLDAMLRDIDAVVDAERFGRVVLIGFYHSVTFALAWAARHPSRVAGLILFGGSQRGWGPMSGPGTQALLSLIDQDWDTFVESAAHAWLGWPSEEEGRLVADWFRTATSPNVARATMRAASAIDVTPLLPHVRSPVLVLHRAEAQVIPLEMSRDLAASLPDARLELLPGRSASLFFDHTDVVVDRIVAFAEHPSTESPATRSPVDPAAAAPPRRPAEPSTTPLSPRESEVLAAIATGDTNAEIAARLGISVNTVERHVSNVYRKIEARGRADATAWALRHGLA